MNSDVENRSFIKNKFSAKSSLLETNHGMARNSNPASKQGKRLIYNP